MVPSRRSGAPLWRNPSPAGEYSRLSVYVFHRSPEWVAMCNSLLGCAPLENPLPSKTHSTHVNSGENLRFFVVCMHTTKKILLKKLFNSLPCVCTRQRNSAKKLFYSLPCVGTRQRFTVTAPFVLPSKWTRVHCLYRVFSLPCVFIILCRVPCIAVCFFLLLGRVHFVAVCSTRQRVTLPCTRYPAHGKDLGTRH